MTFVYSNWYIVMALLVVAIVALVVIFIKMDKKDRTLINDFVKSMQQEANESVNSESAQPQSTEEVKE